jgi:hypothetical protein
MHLAVSSMAMASTESYAMHVFEKRHLRSDPFNHSESELNQSIIQSPVLKT